MDSTRQTPSPSPLATPSLRGEMSASDKTKLDSITAGAAAVSSASPQPVGAVAAGAGTLASRDDHVHAHGVQALDGTMHALATTSTAGFLSSSDKATLNNLVATWADRAWFAVDYDAGNDANAGFSTVDGPTAMGVAVKTLTRLNQILPQFGMGKRVTVLIKPRAAAATYRNPGNSADDDLILNVANYTWLEVRASDGTDTTADKRTQGAIISEAGPNGDGSWTCAAGGTVSAFTVAAGSLPAEYGTTTGARVRFQGNVTAGLANLCEGVWSNTTGAGVITTMEDLPFAPGTGEKFWIERPAVCVGNVYIGVVGAGGDVNTTTDVRCVIAGIRTTGTKGWQIMGTTMPVALTFCESAGASTGLTLRETQRVDLLNSLPLIDGTSLGNLGIGLRSFGGHSLGPAQIFNARASSTIASGGVSGTDRIQSGNMFQSSVLRSGIGVNTSGLGPAGGFNSGRLHLGDSPGVTTRRPLRVTGSGGFVSANNSNLSIAHLDVTGIASGGAITIAGNNVSIRVEDCVGSSGNTGFGLSLSGISANVAGSMIFLGTDNTITGTSGDVGNFGSSTTWAALQVTGFTDQIDNRIASRNVSGLAKGFPITVSGGVVGHVIRITGSVAGARAQADSVANAAGVCGVVLTSPPSGAALVAFSAPFMWVRMDAAATPGNFCYLSEANAGQGKSVSPANNGTNAKLRLGVIIAAQLISAVNYALVAWNPERLAQLSDAGV